ncbi:Os02g0615650 [Oryza sativa Japonica Group]|uniref:Os02g0615650 protein n=2 Tax=Oryza sativa subsp. japonica TaxID=39947 RepID=Q6K7X1_ORYSJ|nr:hypothetical protein [Oryza sativa Japonica Group]BAS79766.1 Os02g0615650 [Oryza sativa Japonica Group]
MRRRRRRRTPATAPRGDPAGKAFLGGGGGGGKVRTVRGRWGEERRAGSPAGHHPRVPRDGGGGGVADRRRGRGGVRTAEDSALATGGGAARGRRGMAARGWRGEEQRAGSPVSRRGGRCGGTVALGSGLGSTSAPRCSLGATSSRGRRPLRSTAAEVDGFLSRGVHATPS